MIKRWMDDIRTKTEHMSREQKTGYVLSYYWYHLLLAGLFLGLCALVVYYIGWGRKETEFSLVLVNQEVDFARDKEINNEFAQSSGISSKEITVDSDYLISYEGVKLEGVNESSYEKFFFNWSAGELDAIIMPESFYQYCRGLGGEFADLTPLLPAQLKESRGLLYEDQGIPVGIVVEGTRLAQVLKVEGNDEVVLVFPAELNHEKACRQFLEYLCQQEGERER